jgi:BirA family biotin operon repressor/biotin-[acetyl-CoA-carboxylase] ligase
MISPQRDGRLVVFDEVHSTQNVAAADLEAGGDYGVVQARNQSNGRGRRDRQWHSNPGDCLLMSLVMRGYANASQPHWIGMALAVVVAEVTDAKVAWPNDVMIDGKKVAGILTEVAQGVPIVGVGINVNTTAFPEDIAHRATSLRLATGQAWSVEDLRDQILEAVEAFPEPTGWDSFGDRWMLRDTTPGKRFLTTEGQIVVAAGVASDGALLYEADGRLEKLYTADGLYRVPSEV